MKKILLITVCVLPILGLLILLQPILFPAKPAVPNSLSEQEIEEGWMLLFDGKTTENWHNYGKNEVGPAWRVEGDALKLHVPQRAGNKAEGGGDLVSDQEFEGDFELKIDWKISRLGNSGIFLFVNESPEYEEIYLTGLELQASDNALYEEAEEAYHTKLAGDVYGISGSHQQAVKPRGEWNQVRVIFQQKHLTVYLNEVKIHDLDLNSARWKEAVAESVLKSAPLSQGKFKGRIGLQDWGSQVWFRNIKIRAL
jgi:hypothetical protein